MSKFGEFDYSQFKDLQKRMQKMQEAYPAFVESCIKELAARLLAKTVARTPVDTGHLRQNWTMGAVVRIAGGYQVEISNPVEYAKYVEYGHATRLRTGWVEGRFMLTISEKELREELPGILDRRMAKFMKDHLG